MKKIILLTILTLNITLSYSQNSTEQLSEKFFEEYSQDTNQALDNLFSTNKWMNEDQNGINKVKFQIREYSNLVGNYLGYDKIGEKSLSESLKIVVYLVKYERQPFRFIFKYYKPKNDWMIYNFSFDENIDDDLEQMMKFDYLNNE